MNDAPSSPWFYTAAGWVAFLGTVLFVRGCMAPDHAGAARAIRWGYLVAGALLVVAGSIIARAAYWHGRVMSRDAPGSCLRCGYSLRGNASGVCPECGTPVGKGG